MNRFCSLVLQLFVFLTAGRLCAREVAITIDDLPRGGDAQLGPQADREMTIKLLAPFQHGHIPLIGFVNECHHHDELTSLLPLWVAAGADLGNHTCSHPDLNNTSVNEFESEILKGEIVTARILGHRPIYFRYPFLHTGQDVKTKQAIEKFLLAHGYYRAPVTLDNSDYMFAAVYAKDLADGRPAEAKHVRSTYVSYMEAIFQFFEHWSVEVTGHEVRQILLIHASQLNADAMPDLLAMMRRRGYRFIPLGRALQDPAYLLSDGYVGRRGLSLIHRWAVAKGMKPKAEPAEPDWIRKQAGF